MPNTPRKNTQKKSSKDVGVKINSRVVFAPGGQGSHKLVKQDTGFMSMLKKSKPAPSAPSINVAKSHIYGGKDMGSAHPDAQNNQHHEMLKEWVPDARNDPYAYWRVVKQASAKQAKAKMLHDAVERVVDKVVHNIHASPYIPPISEKSRQPVFNLVSVEEYKLICNAARVVCLKEDTLLEVDPPCKIFGDIHGQISDMLQFFRQYGAPSHRVGDINICKYIFIGDFVDRGR
jgi:hypothetical protein